MTLLNKFFYPIKYIKNNRDELPCFKEVKKNERTSNRNEGQVKETIATLITTAFGLIAALAWNEAIKALITQYLGAGSGLAGLLTYAILITIIAIIATILIARVLAKPTVQAVRIVE